MLLTREQTRSALLGRFSPVIRKSQGLSSHEGAWSPRGEAVLKGFCFAGYLVTTGRQRGWNMLNTIVMNHWYLGFWYFL